MVLDEVKDKYKEYAKFFQEYDRPPQHEHQPIATKEKNLDPFKKINWKNLYDSNELNRFHYKLVDDKLVWAYIISESKSKSVYFSRFIYFQYIHPFKLIS